MNLVFWKQTFISVPMFYPKAGLKNVWYASCHRKVLARVLKLIWKDENKVHTLQMVMVVRFQIISFKRVNHLEAFDELIDDFIYQARAKWWLSRRTWWPSVVRLCRQSHEQTRSHRQGRAKRDRWSIKQKKCLTTIYWGSLNFVYYFMLYFNI